ncbi:MAG: septal ring lytic transglycosylase RlpA family protein [Ignavibacteriae bacterium]|nr:septal ring lytic transglycosylase RlpA family protein [Ignavibacteriota bacterium]
MKNICKILLIISPVLLAVACSPAVRFSEKSSTTLNSRDTEEPTKAVAGQTFRGIASFYADKFHGRKTSSGEIFDMNGFTAAHRTLPFGTKLQVTNLKNGKSVIVKVNDRGPFKEERILDLSRAAAESIDMVNDGTAEVEIKVLE